MKNKKLTDDYNDNDVYFCFPFVRFFVRSFLFFVVVVVKSYRRQYICAEFSSFLSFAFILSFLLRNETYSHTRYTSL